MSLPSSFTYKLLSYSCVCFSGRSWRKAKENEKSMVWCGGLRILTGEKEPEKTRHLRQRFGSTVCARTHSHP